VINLLASNSRDAMINRFVSNSLDTVINLLASNSRDAMINRLASNSPDPGWPGSGQISKPDCLEEGRHGHQAVCA
jgi:hypothetical protein